MKTTRGVLRHKKFAHSVARLAKVIPRVDEMIEGAIWSISRDPEREGVRNPTVGVWQATIIAGGNPDSPRVLIFYAFNRRLVRFLTVALDTTPLN